jgi:hypothetical protein
VRYRFHEFAHLGFQKIIGDDQSPDRAAHIAAARRDGLIDRRFKPFSFGFWIGRGMVHGLSANCSSKVD